MNGRMRVFGFLRRKKPKWKVPLVFKGVEEAFEYSCKFMTCNLLPKTPLPAIVVDARELFGAETAIKKNEDGTQVAALKVASDDGGFLVTATTIGIGPDLKVGDFVMWTPYEFIEEVAQVSEDRRFGWLGVIIGTLKTELNEKGWVGNCLFE